MPLPLTVMRCGGMCACIICIAFKLQDYTSQQLTLMRKALVVLIIRFELPHVNGVVDALGPHLMPETMIAKYLQLV